MNVVDSSGWLEYFTDGRHSGFFSPAIENTDRLVVPVITIYEVFKKVLKEEGEDKAFAAANAMRAGLVVDLDTSLALEAARLKLPLADSLIYAATMRYQAILWTQDEHFKGLPSVKWIAK